MARIRTIKPEVLDDEKSAGLSSNAWRLWVSTWVMADDHGRLRGEPRWLHNRVFWSCPHPVDVDFHLNELETAGLITRYVVNEQKYVGITNWTKHQRIDNASKGLVPGPEDEKSTTYLEFGEVSPRTAANRREPPLDHDHDHDHDHECASASPPSSSFDFEAVYESYPRKLGRKKGLQRCRSQIKTREKYDALLRAVKNYAASTVGTEPQFVKQFDTFMSCWEDYVNYTAPPRTPSSNPKPSPIQPRIPLFTGLNTSDDE